MRLFSVLSALACLATAPTLLVGCTAKEEAGPNQPCATGATVRFCLGKTAVCLTEHTALELADGTRLRPQGQLWQAYLPKQANGQRLRISYELMPFNHRDVPPSDTPALLTCLEAGGDRCGTVGRP